MGKPLVSINCITFNHAPYIRQCLDAFINQKTNFSFEVLIHDDASTDGTSDIIREYATCYPDIIKPYIQEKNQYSQGKGYIGDDINRKRALGKYIAECEGDDYWIDPLKLQRQVDFMEFHPDYSMCCCDGIIDQNGIHIEKDKYLDPTRKLIDWGKYKSDCDIPAGDMIVCGGGFVLTASIMYRREILDDYPKCCRECYVGDYPLQVWCVLIGKVRYFSKKMVTYRFMTHGSWSTSIRTIQLEDRLYRTRSTLLMLEELDKYSKGKYHVYFEKAITDTILAFSTSLNDSIIVGRVWCNEIKHLSLQARLKIIKHKMKLLVHFILKK